MSGKTPAKNHISSDNSFLYKMRLKTILLLAEDAALSVKFHMIRKIRSQYFPKSSDFEKS